MNDKQIKALMPKGRYLMGAAPAATGAQAQADQGATVAWLQRCLRECGRCPDGGKCHHDCEQAAPCFRSKSCVPLSGSGLRDDWSLPTSAAPTPAAQGPDIRPVVGKLARLLQQCADHADPVTHATMMREVATRLLGILQGVEIPLLGATPKPTKEQG